MSKLDQAYGYARAVSAPGEQQHYIRGAELFYSIWNYVKDKLASDCSGAMIGLWKRVNALFLVSGKWVSYGVFFGTARPTANVMYRKALALGEVFDDPALIQPGDHGFHVNSSNVAKHVWINWGHQDVHEAAAHGNHSSSTFESGDGSGHAAFHTDLWQRQHPKGYRIRYGRFPHDMGDLTPLSGTPTPLDWPQTGATYNRWGDHVREIAGALKWAVKNQVNLPNLNTTDSNAARLYGYGHQQWMVRFQVEAGLPRTSFMSTSVIAAIQKALRALVG